MSGSLGNNSLASIAAQPSPTDPSAQQPPKPLPAPLAGGDGTLLTQLVDWWEEQEWSTRDARLLSERDRDYFDGYQWTPDELRILHDRGQPALVINYVKRKINYLMGFERRLRSDPKAFPRNPQEEQEADASTQALRFVSDDNNHDQVRSSVFENMVIEGTGGSELVGEPAQDGSIAIREHHISHSKLWWDPYSAKLDFSDSRYMGIVIWCDKDQALMDYPDCGDVIESTIINGVFDDKPDAINWIDSRRSRVRIIQCNWQQNGDWWTAKYTRGGFVEKPQVSPYIDRRGKTCSSINMRSAYIDRENRRYGEVRQYISMQDELNKRRSKALHILNSRQVIVGPGVVEDIGKMRRELARPDGVVEIMDPDGKLDIRDNQDMASGQMELLQHVAAEINATGPNAAMAGKDPREQSGRAIQAQQQGGAVEQEPLIDSLRQWDRKVYEAMWMRIRQFMTGPQWIRITNDTRNVKWVGLNHPVTLQDELGQMPPDQRAQTMQQMQLVPNDPRLQQVIRTENDISQLDVDITVEEGPDISTMNAQTFQDLGNMVQAGVQIPPAALIEASPLPQDTKDKILEMMQQAQAAQAATQQQAAVMQHNLAMAKLGQISAQTQSDTASANDKQAAAALKVHKMATDHAATQVSPHTVGGALDPSDVAGAPMTTLGGAPDAPPPQAAPLGQPPQ